MIIMKGPKEDLQRLSANDVFAQAISML